MILKATTDYISTEQTDTTFKRLTEPPLPIQISKWSMFGLYRQQTTSTVSMSELLTDNRPPTHSWLTHSNILTVTDGYSTDIAT